MRISDWSSDVCSSDLCRRADLKGVGHSLAGTGNERGEVLNVGITEALRLRLHGGMRALPIFVGGQCSQQILVILSRNARHMVLRVGVLVARSEEHTSELQSLMRISYAVFCLKKKQ